MSETKSFTNPYRPGAGHMPPFLAGRTHETKEFRKLLEQSLILENMVLTGLRGVGKTVLMERKDRYACMCPDETPWCYSASFGQCHCINAAFVYKAE